MSSYQIRIELPPTGSGTYEEPEFPVFGIHVAGDELLLWTVVRKEREQVEGLTTGLVTQIIRSTWTVDHIEEEKHPDLRHTVYFVVFNISANVVKLP